MNALEIKELTKERNGFTLNNINLTLPMGYILGYVGQNGAGKTTTIQCILNLLKPDHGTIQVADNTYQKNPEQYLDSIGYISDECILPAQFKLKDVLNTMQDFYPSFSKSKFQSYCNLWKLPENKKVSELSKGMQIRLMFAVILSRKTKLLVLDEATSGLDPVIRNDILELLQTYIEDGEHSVLLSTHIMSDLEQVADYICFIDQGKQIFFDTVDEILDSYRVIKGGASQLDSSLNDKLIGAKLSKTSFEGLISSNDIASLSRQLLLEKPTIEQIVLFHIKGMRGY